MQKQDSEPRGVALIGLPASGKTSAGAILAGLEGLPFVDLDEVVASDSGSSIPAIFENEGEAGFRLRESAALARIAAGGPVVLATGGGTVESPENRALLRERFRVAWIKADPAILAERSVGCSRPLLAGDAEGKIRVLYARRKPWYEECANIVVQSDGMRPSMIAKTIHDSLR